MPKPGEHECSHDKRWSVYSQKDLASAFECEPRTVATWVSDGLPRWPASANRHRYCITCTIRWREKQRPQLVKHEPIVVDGEEDLYAGGSDSPNLERYRLAKAKLAELDLEVRKGSLITVDRINDALTRAAMMIRRLGERLGKRFGNEAALSVIETMQEFDRLILSGQKAHGSDANNSGD